MAHFAAERRSRGCETQLQQASDAELFRAGDADAFAEIYDRYVRQVFGWARARVGEHAADLTAEVFARAWLAVRMRCTPQAARLRVSRLLRQLQYALGGQQP